MSQSETIAIYKQLTKANGFNRPPSLVFSNDSSVNASYGGGIITVNKGMLRFVRNKAEMASVLGHELGHYTSWSYGWKGEYDADAKSFKYMSKAGYSPCEGLLVVKRFHDKGSSTHPPSDARYYKLCKQ